jgi:hypothetical protein
MKAFFVAYDCGELYKKSRLKIIKDGYVKSCPKQPAIQIWSLKILEVILYTNGCKNLISKCFDAKFSHQRLVIA